MMIRKVLTRSPSSFFALHPLLPFDELLNGAGTGAPA
jgi:hypothetical protein